jgi:hypothetical protein
MEQTGNDGCIWEHLFDRGRLSVALVDHYTLYYVYHFTYLVTFCRSKQAINHLLHQVQDFDGHGVLSRHPVARRSLLNL